MDDLFELLKPILPIIIGIAVLGFAFIVIVSGLSWLFSHPLALLFAVLCIAGVIFILVKGKFIGSNRV